MITPKNNRIISTEYSLLSTSKDMANIPAPYFSSEPYTEEELMKLESTFLTSPSYALNSASDFHRLRDLTIIKISSFLGLRPGETLNLRWDMINWDSNEIYLNPYTNKVRQAAPVVLNEKAKQILLAWKEVFSQFIKCIWVFPSLQTFEPLSTSGYAKRLRAISVEAGIYRVVWYTEAGQPIGNRRHYSARKYFGTTIYKRTKDRDLLKRGLRHTRWSSGEPYVYSSNDQTKLSLDAVFK